MATAPAGWTGPGGADDMWTGCVGPEQGLRTPSVGVWQDRRRGLLSEAPPFLQCWQSTRPPSGYPVSVHGQCESVREATEWAGLVRRFQPQATGP